MVRIEGQGQVTQRLKAMADSARKDKADGEVGYSMPYSVYVHENLQAHHEHGNAKFLEGPSRKYAREIGRVIAAAYQQSHDMKKAVMAGLLRLLRESQKEVPVRSGALKASGYAALKADVAKASHAAFTAGQAILAAWRGKGK